MSDDTVTCTICNAEIRRDSIAVAPEFIDGVRIDFCTDAHKNSWDAQAAAQKAAEGE